MIEMHVKKHGDTLITLAELAKLTALSIDEVKADVEELKDQGLVTAFEMRKDTYVWHADSVREAQQTLAKALETSGDTDYVFPEDQA